MRQVGVGGEGMDGWEGRAGGMVKRGDVAGRWEEEKRISSKSALQFSDDF